MSKKISKIAPSVLHILKNIWEKWEKCDYQAEFVAATLYLGNPFDEGQHLLVSYSEDKEPHACSLEDFYLDRPLTEEEIYYYSKIYAKFKTPNHHFFEIANKYIKDYETKYGIKD